MYITILNWFQWQQARAMNQGLQASERATVSLHQGKKQGTLKKTGATQNFVLSFQELASQQGRHAGKNERDGWEPVAAFTC
jgi:hypothetical protein